jgi:hypothetical protein
MGSSAKVSRGFTKTRADSRKIEDSVDYFSLINHQQPYRKKMQYITFVNESPLPVNVEAWQPMFAGFMSEMKTQLVRPGGRIFMGSETGEWTLNTYFCDKELSDEWGRRAGEVIGKIQEAVCKDKIGVYSWIYNTDFTAVCENRVVTFSKK